ncbi:hypothetical protein [Streptomyces sp. NPDC058457]
MPQARLHVSMRHPRSDQDGIQGTTVRTVVNEGRHHAKQQHCAVG